MGDAEIERELAEELGVGKMFKEWHEFPIMCEGELIVLAALVKERKERMELEQLRDKTADVLLQHMNGEDYEMSLAGLYTMLTEHLL